MPVAQLVAINEDVDLELTRRALRSMFGLEPEVHELDNEQVCAILGAGLDECPAIDLGYGGLSCHPATAKIYSIVGGGEDGFTTLTPDIRDAILAAADIKAGAAFFAGQTGDKDEDFFWVERAELAAFLGRHMGRPIIWSR